MTTTSGLICPPRFGTPRTPERPTLGPAVGKVARLLGKPLLPWQQYVADVSLEIDPLTGRLAYEELGLTVPRQSGKSTLVLAKSTHRCSATDFFGARQHVVYTAQTRNKAREKWQEDYLAELSASSAFKSRIKASLANGNEHIRFQNGSKFGIEANTEKAGHGGTLDEAYIDEAFAQADARLEQAFEPAMITRTNTLLAWISTAGWKDASPYLQPKVSRGREQAQMGVREGLAYFEWSASEDADPADPQVWRACMPALGHLFDEAAIIRRLKRAEEEGKFNDFRRAYLNQWVSREEDDPPVISEGVWSSLADPDSTALDPVVFAVAVTPMQDAASISISGRRADGLAHLEVVDSRPGTGWVVDRLSELVSRWRPAAVVLDGSGPAGSLLPSLSERGVDVTKASMSDYAQACGAFYDAAVNRQLRHLADSTLDRAVAAGRKRPLSDRWAWGRKGSADITPLEAATLALWALPAHRTYDVLESVF